MALAADHLTTIIGIVRQLPEAQQAEIIRRLGNPRPEPGLGAIAAAWPKLPPMVRQGIVATVKAVAKGAEP
ncbi:MAG TPA: hypothetical protein VMV69_02560 [Pirellulales bacterium]|nr:hypothetical protein [Pirellulales bacterium]